jgi:transposase
VQLRETCDEEQVHLLTQVKTTPANMAEAKCPDAMQRALLANGRAPGTHLADAGDIAADLFVQSETHHGIILVGPVRDRARRQHHVDGAYGLKQFTIDWAAHGARCPQGHRSASWYPFQPVHGHRYISVTSAKEDGTDCPQRARCPRAQTQPRSLQLQPQLQQAAIDRLRAYLASDAGRQL